jgi:hypothetical protein
MFDSLKKKMMSPEWQAQEIKEEIKKIIEEN